MRLLFITQKIHENDDDLAFVILWIKQFIKEGFEVQTICLQKGEFSDQFPVYSLGKEKGYSKFRQIGEFFKLIFTLRYDRVFVHMNPEYFTLAGWYWYLKGIPTYLWYTHYTRHLHLRLAAFFSKRLFAATAQSLPHYDNSPKKIVTGHGIDIDFWLSNMTVAPWPPPAEELLVVHRLCRSKRLEIELRALDLLPAQYTLTVYGRDVEKDYYQELQDLVQDKHLSARVKFTGPVPMAQLKNIYGRHRLLVNLAHETIDKTMLEAMLFGVYPVTTPANSRAIGLSVYPTADTPEAIADFIQGQSWQSFDRAALQQIVRERHSLSALIKRMGDYIRAGK